METFSRPSQYTELISPESCVSQITESSEKYLSYQSSSIQDIIQISNYIVGHDALRCQIIAQCNAILTEAISNNDAIFKLCNTLHYHHSNFRDEIRKYSSSASENKSAVDSRNSKLKDVYDDFVEILNEGVGELGSSKIESKPAEESVNMAETEAPASRTSETTPASQSPETTPVSKKPEAKSTPPASKAEKKKQAPVAAEPVIEEEETISEPEESEKEAEDDDDWLPDEKPEKEEKPAKKVRNFKKKHTCDACDNAFRKKQDLESHRLKVHGIKDFKCEVCNEAFETKAKHKFHMRSHDSRDREKFPCEVMMCTRVFQTKSGLDLHKLRVHDIKPKCGRWLECTYCNDYFRSRPDFEKHLRKHTNEKPFVCEICGNKFKLEESLKYHILAHKGEKPYKCKSCDFMGRSKSILRNHVKSHHTLNRVKNFICDLCGKSFFSRNAWHDHTLHHTNRQPYECDLCEKKFARKRNLTEHREIHLGTDNLKTFSCEICGHTTRQKYNIVVHMRTHTKEKPYKCDICGQFFMYTVTLQQHKRSCMGPGVSRNEFKDEGPLSMASYGLFPPKYF